MRYTVTMLGFIDRVQESTCRQGRQLSRGAAALLVVATACSGGSESGQDGESTSSASAVETGSPPTSRSNELLPAQTVAINNDSEIVDSTSPGGAEGLVITFDDLGSGYEEILVYPGVTSSEADKRPNGIFFDGDQVVADCETVGRSLPAVPELEAMPPYIDRWVRFSGLAGRVHYASVVYLEKPEVVLEQLQSC